MRSLLTSAAIGALTAGTAHAQQPADAQPGAEEAREVIVVTGTRTRGRSALETLAPVDVIGIDSLENNGSTELNVALSYALPSFQFPQPSLTDGTDSVRPATLRGLGPDQTLTLVNGKRRHVSALVNLNGSVGRGSAAVDLNTIPTTAIGSVEVLRDGASAQYGSDAIAGVINVRLREAAEGGAVTATYGTHATTVPVSAGERDEFDGETFTLAGWQGLPLGDDGFITLSAEFRDRKPTNRSGPDIRQQYADPDDPRELTFDRLSFRYGNPDSTDISLMANAGLPINDQAELYAFASYQDRESSSAGFYRLPGAANNQPDIYPDGFLPLIEPEVQDYSFGAGVRGDAGEWAWDVSLVHGVNDLDYYVNNTANVSLGPDSPTYVYAGNLKFDQTTFNADISRAIPVQAFSGPLNVAAGVEARRENYQIGAGQPESYITGEFDGPGGSQVFPGFQPQNEVDENRESYSAYIDFEADVTDRLTLSAAGRYEDFSDFGDTLNGKLSGRFELTDALALRGSVSTGFRAPSLHQSWFTSTATVFTDGVPNETGTFPVSSDEAVALGATPLEAETSTNYSAGFVFSQGGLSVTVDAYRIDIEDRILLSENLSGEQVAALLPEGITAARFFLNGADTETTGVDIVANYDWTVDQVGDFTATLGFNWNEIELSNIQSTGVLSELDPPPTIFGRVEQLRLEQGTPSEKIIAGLDWDRDRLGGFVRATRFGEVYAPNATPENDFTLDPQWVVDIEGDVDVTERLNFAVGANNVFDSYPDRTPDNLSLNGVLAFSSFAPAGFNGRYVYARARYAW